MRLLAALLLWLTLALPAYGQVGNLNRVNVQDYGAVGDGVTDNTAAFQAAIARSNSTGACLYIPYSTNGYFTSAALSWPVGSGDKCIVGDNLNTTQNYPPTQKTVIKTTDTDCIDTNGQRLNIYQISCLGNGSTSSSTADTVCVNYYLANGGYEPKIFNVTCSGYVEGFRLHTRIRGEFLSVDNSGLRPNLVNNFPSYCIHAIDAVQNVEAVHMSGVFCRDQGFVTTAEFTGDGATTFFDFHLNTSSGIANQANTLWASDGIKACKATATGSRYPCIALVPGADMTLYDCGASACGGSGGTLLPAYVKTASTTAGNPQITVADTTGLSAGTQYKAIAEHNLKEPTYVVSVDDGTHVTLSNAPTSTDTAVKYTFIQVNLSAGSCGLGTAPTCGYNLELRFTSAPASGINVEVIHSDPWSYAAIYEEVGTESDYDMQLVAGIRTVLQTGGVGTYGGTHVNVAYWEIGNYCMVVDEAAAGGYFGAATGVVVTMQRNVRPITASGTNRRCPIWTDPAGYGNYLVWNGSSWRQFEGTTSFNGSAVSWTMGSDTAPISQTAGKVEISLADITCPGGASNLNFQASEDGTTFLAGTSYLYSLNNQTPTAGAYTTLNSTGTKQATIPISNGNLDTSGAYNGTLILAGAGLTAEHPMQVRVAHTDASDVQRWISGAATIVGTPAPLKALRVSCTSGSSGPLTGQIWYRELWN